MDLFATVEQDFRRRRDAGEVSRGFEHWRREHAALRPFASADDVIAACRGKEASPEAVNGALGALCAEARDGDDTAATLLVWLMLPGLLRLRARLRPGRPLAPEDLDGELVAGMWEAVARLREEETRVARRLLNAARWRALAAMREAIEWKNRARELPADERDASGASLEEGDGELTLAEAVREGVVSAEQVELVTATRRTIRELAQKLGISLHAAQCRKHRARDRLHGWLERRSRPPANLPRASSGEPPAETGRPPADGART